MTRKDIATQGLQGYFKIKGGDMEKSIAEAIIWDLKHYCLFEQCEKKVGENWEKDYLKSARIAEEEEDNIKFWDYTSKFSNILKKRKVRKQKKWFEV